MIIYEGNQQALNLLLDLLLDIYLLQKGETNEEESNWILESKFNGTKCESPKE